MIKRNIIIFLGIISSILTIILIFIQSKLQNQFNNIYYWYILTLISFLIIRQIYNHLFINYLNSLELEFSQKMQNKIIYNENLQITKTKEQLYIFAEKYFKIVVKNKINFIIDSILFILISYIFIYINIYFGIFSIIFIILLFIVLNKSKNKYKENINEFYSFETSHLQNMQNYFRNLKYYNARNNKQIISKLEDETKNLDKIFNKNALHSNKYKTFYRIFNELYIILSLIFLIALYNNKQITIEILFFIFFLTTIITNTIRQLSNEYLEMQWDKEFVDDTNNEYNQVNVDVQKINLIAKSISIENRKILSNININISNESVLLIGKSGIGKSTLVKTILGINNQFEGKRYINSKEYNGIINQGIGYINDTKIRKMGKLSDEISNYNDYVDLLTKFNLINQKYQSKEFLNDIMWAQILSTGEYRRFLVLLEILRKPKFLFLDEALDNIDWNTAKEILNILVSIEQLTCIVISHNKDFKTFFTKTYEVTKNATKLL